MAVTATAGLLAAAVAAAGAVSDGAKNAAFAGAISSGIGSGYKIVARRNGIVVLDMTMSGSLGVSSAGISLPDSYASLSTLLAADIDSGTWTLRIEKASDSAVYLEGTIGRSGTDFILSDDLDPALGIALSGVFLQVVLDTPVGGSWIDVGLSDMRKVGWSGSYATSYAANDDILWGRNSRSYSSQSERASLAMSHYPNSTAFTSTNPDFALELSYLSGSAFVTANWGRIIFWNQIFLSQTHKNNHLPGYTGNSRVAMFDTRIYVKSLAGTWSRLVMTNSLSGAGYGADFSYSPSAQTDSRIESGTGYRSARPVPDAGAPGVPYWIWHGYTGLTTINKNDIAQVLVCQKAQLVLHNPAGTDDRDYARFLMAVGADYYPATGSFDWYPGIGTSRHKYVTAKAPAYQWHVMHTMTEAEFNAAGGYPAELAGA